MERLLEQLGGPLGDAIIEDSLDKVRELVRPSRAGRGQREGLSPDQALSTRAYHSGTALPLLLALDYGRLEIFDWLVDRNATIDVLLDSLSGMEGNTLGLLHLACMKASRLPFAQKLINAGAKVASEDKFGWQPLHWAALKGHMNLVLLLLENGADPAAADADGELPQHKAQRGGHKEVLGLLQSQYRERYPSAPVPALLQPTALSVLQSRIAIVGDAAVGKTSLVQKFIANQFRQDVPPTIGAFYSQKTVKMGPTRHDLEIRDIGGQIRYQGLSPVYYRGCNIVLVVFDLTRASTFELAQRWIMELHLSMPPQTIIVLVGNKLDLALAGERKVDPETVRTFAKDYSIVYIETSTATGRHTYDVFAFSLKFYDTLVGRYSKSAQPPLPRKKQATLPPNCPCSFEDLRTGKARQYTHDSLQIPRPVRKGYLMKQGHWIMNWKRRWFVLQDDYLYYYKTMTDVTPAGIVFLRDCSIGMVTGEMYPHTFEIKPSASSHTRYLISGDTEAESQTWIDALESSRMRTLQLRTTIPFHFTVLDPQLHPFPPEPYGEIRVTMEAKDSALNFYKDSVFSWQSKALFSYPLTEPMRVLRPFPDERFFYLVDEQGLRLRIFHYDNSQLFAYLKGLLPASTRYGTMDDRQYIETLVVAYDSACHRLKIPMIHSVIGQCTAAWKENRPLTRLCLDEIEITSRDAEALGFALSHYPHCTTLQLRRLNLPTTTINVLTNELLYLRSIVTLDMSNSRFAEQTTVDAVCNLLKRTETLENLHLNSCQLSVNAAVAIGTAISSRGEMSTLKVVELNDNSSSEDRVFANLSKFVEYSRNILVLRCNAMPCSIKMLPLLLRALTRNKTLILLEMDSSHLPSQQQHIITSMLQRNRSRPGLHDQLVSFALVSARPPEPPARHAASSSELHSSHSTADIDGWIRL